MISQIKHIVFFIGLLEGLGILTVSNTVTFVTSLSMSAVSTNGQITAGGIYYMISRSLGDYTIGHLSMPMKLLLK
jgi:solute carrier family 12 (sodium/potassium/chloride transporter), member 2